MTVSQSSELNREEVLVEVLRIVDEFRPPMPDASEFAKGAAFTAHQLWAAIDTLRRSPPADQDEPSSRNARLEIMRLRADIERLHAAVNQLVATMQSAPKDQSIMLWARGNWHIGKWDADQYAQKPRPFWDYSDIWGRTGCRAEPPTYWMPLPAAPVGSSAPISAG